MTLEGDRTMSGRFVDLTGATFRPLGGGKVEIEFPVVVRKIKVTGNSLSEAARKLDEEMEKLRVAQEGEKE